MPRPVLKEVLQWNCSRAIGSAGRAATAALRARWAEAQRGMTRRALAGEAAHAFLRVGDPCRFRVPRPRRDEFEKERSVVRHFPDVAVRVSKGPSETTPVGNGGSADYRTPDALCFQQYLVDLLRCPNVVSELYPGAPWPPRTAHTAKTIPPA